MIRRGKNPGPVPRAAIIALLVCALASHAPAAMADTAPSPGPSGAAAAELSDGDTVDSICGNILAEAQNQPSPTPQEQAGTAPSNGKGPKPLNQQKLQYCQAAKSAQDAADADSVMWKVWAGVAAVCTTACVLAATSVVDGGTTQYVCAGASIAGGVTDAVVTKNFMSALMGIGGAGAGLLVNNMTSSSAQNGAKQKDWGSCLSAAMAAMQVFMKYSSMNSSNDTVASNLKNAKALKDTDSPALDGSGQGYAPQQMASSDGGGSGTGGNSSVSNSGGGVDGNGTTIKSGCTGASQNPTYQGVMQCATADNNLPGFVRGPNFTKELQKDSGMPFGDFMTKAQNPSQAMAMGTGGALNAAQESKLAAALQDMQSHMADGSEGNSMYAGGGSGGGNGGGDGSDAQLGQMMQGLMDQLMPKKPGDNQPRNGVEAVAFANQRRGPAAVAEDRKLSIFDRITYRYYFVGRRIIFGGDGR